jgi:transcription elongation factor SPT6
MTEDDEMVRRADIPERHQYSNSTLSTNPLKLDQSPYPELDAATAWVATRVSDRTRHMCLEESAPSGGRDQAPRYDLKEEYFGAVKEALRCLFLENLEVPLLWHHRRDSFIELTPNLRNYATFLVEDELWTCYDLGVKYKAIYERHTDLRATYEKMRDIDPTFVDRYFEDFVLAVPDGTAQLSVEAVGEALAWLELRYPRLAVEVKQMSIAPEERKQTKRAGGVSASRFSRETPGFGEFIEVCVWFGRSGLIVTRLKHVFIRRLLAIRPESIRGGDTSRHWRPTPSIQRLPHCAS